MALLKEHFNEIMKTEQKQIEQIRQAFATMQYKQDLLDLLNLAKSIIYGDHYVPFQLAQLTYYIQSKIDTEYRRFSFETNAVDLNNPEVLLVSRPNERYHSFTLKKKSGGTRTIHAPVNGLKAIQRSLAFILQCVFEPHPAANGFVMGKSIVDNAKIHVGNNYVYNIDLKDFFPSIDQARVWKCLQLSPFNLSDSVALTEEEKLNATQTGIRKFRTDHSEEIYYKIEEGGKIWIIDDNTGNFKRYKDRLTAHIPKLEKMLALGDNEGITKHQAYRQEKNRIIHDDLKRYILDEDNKRILLNQSKSRQRVASIIAMLCCTEMDVERKNKVSGEWETCKQNVLPQGAPTSPVITNIVCYKLDRRLSGLAKRFGLKYSRYADDITFSSMHNVYQPESAFLNELHRIISDQNFHIKESKTRLQKEGYRKEVTGLLVNEKVNVQQRYIKQLRMWLYYWETYGYERASGYFLRQYITDKGHVKNGKPDMVNVIGGKLDYLKMVKGADNELYIKLKGRFELLIGFEDPINQVLNVWETDGIEQAMDFYYKDKLE
jgi:retron-type reverse transcriptase